MPNTFTVVRSTRIAVPAASVHSMIDDFHRWQSWSPWEGIDPTLQRTYSGPPAGVGTAYAWKGNRKVGEGRMEITASSPEQIVLDLHFIKPFAAQNVTTFDLVERDGATEVTWTMTGPMTLLNKVFGIFMSMDRMVGRDFEKGLAAMRQSLESVP